MAEASVRLRSGLSRAVADSLLTSRVVEAPRSSFVLCPRPRHLPTFNRGCSSESLAEEEAALESDSAHGDSDLDASVAELKRILEVDCTLDSDSSTFLGVSPPLRSGAHNPLAHDSQWKLKAQQASRSSLEALQRAGGLDRASVASGSLQCCGAATQCRGDLRVLLSPQDLGLLSEACEAAPPPAAGTLHRGRRAVPAAPAWRGAGLSPGARIFS